MEEHIGQLWHRLIIRAASATHPQAGVALREVERTAGILFRALGGDGGLRIETATAVEHTARRSWLARLAGVQRRVELAWRDEQTLRLPERIELFGERQLNRALYLWLAALAAVEPPTDDDWFVGNQRRTQRVLERFPGLNALYQPLVHAHLALRPNPTRLSASEAAVERAIQQALRKPGSVVALPPAPRPPQPVYLWLHPKPPRPENRTTEPTDDADAPAQTAAPNTNSEDQRRRHGERVDEPDGRKGLLVFRLESLFSWSEYVNVDRPTEEDEAIDAQRVADDLEVISVSRANQRPKSRLRFDLDLPAAEYDDAPLGEGSLLPEWHYRRKTLLADHCCVQLMIAADALPSPLPPHLQRAAKRLRQQFQALAPMRVWHRGEPDGGEIDLEAWLKQAADRQRGQAPTEQNLYRDFRGGRRELACLLLADLSLSTDAWITNQYRVIDVIRDSLYLFAEALTATQDRFALYGFSSRRRQHVRLHVLKSFGESYTAKIRGRIQAIRPGYYTRMGAAIRYAAQRLQTQQAAQRLLLLLTDGKPNDLDRYEGRYGVEDTRMSIIEAKRAGLTPFCVTIDREARAYLPYLFGSGNFVVIRNPGDLPRQLPLLYARLSR